MPILSVSDLVQHFPIAGSKAVVRAVNGVSFELDNGRRWRWWANSGSGKTTIGRCVLGLIRPTAGAIVYREPRDGRPAQRALRELRGKLQLVFQEPCGIAEPAAAPVRADRGAAARAQGQPGRARTAGTGGGAAGRPGGESARAVPRRDQHGAAAAGRHRAGDDLGARDRGARRADLGARSYRAGRDHRPPDPHSARPRHGLSVHQPRPLGGAPHQPSSGGALPRHDRRAGPEHASCSRSRAIPTRSGCCPRSCCRTPSSSARPQIRLEGEIPSPIDLPKACYLAGRCPLVQARCRERMPEVGERRAGSPRALLSASGGGAAASRRSTISRVFRRKPSASWAPACRPGRSDSAIQ